MNSSLKQQLIKDAEAVIARHPELSIGWKDGLPVKIVGPFIIVDGKGQPQGNYDIEVLIPIAYPFEFPKLMETGGKIPRLQERHMVVDGEACTENIRRKEILQQSGITLVGFFRQYVNPFFCWQLVYEIEGPSKLSGWPHGVEGIKQFYYEILGTTDEEVIKAGLSMLVYRSQPGRNDPCFCDSSKKFKHCHLQPIEGLARLPRSSLSEDLKLFYVP